MEYWLEWARGPAFRFAFVVMLLGLFRLVILNIIGIITLVRQAQDKNDTDEGRRSRHAPMALSFQSRSRQPQAFLHVGFIRLPHLHHRRSRSSGSAYSAVGERTGDRWPAIPQTWADTMTLIAIATAVILRRQTGFDADLTRSLSRAQDYLLPLIIAVPFISGYLAMHPRSIHSATTPPCSCT